MEDEPINQNYLICCDTIENSPSVDLFLLFTVHSVLCFRPIMIVHNQKVWWSSSFLVESWNKAFINSKSSLPTEWYLVTCQPAGCWDGQGNHCQKEVSDGRWGYGHIILRVTILRKVWLRKYRMETIVICAK